MTFTQYQEEAARTCASLGSVKLDLCHLALGMNSEIYELQEAVEKKDPVNIGEECADVAWYTFNYIRIKRVTFSMLQMERDDTDLMAKTLAELFPIEKLVEQLYYTTSKFQDCVKKFVAYDKEVSASEEGAHLYMILVFCEAICLKNGLDFHVQLQTNISKLRERYPHKFTSENAINRDVKKERKILEDGAKGTPEVGE